MATTVAKPVAGYVAQLLALAAGGVAQSSSLTLTVDARTYWEAQVPIAVSHVGSISADPVVNVFTSMDGGATFDSQPFQVMSLQRVSGGGQRRASLRFSTGYYLVQLLNAGPNSACFAVDTQMVITAVNLV